MVCTGYSEALNDLAAGGVASPDLTSHLNGCERCRKTLAVLVHMLAIADEEFGGLAAQDPSPGFTHRIRAAVEKPRFTFRSLRGWLQPSMMTATALVAGLALVLKWHPVQEPPSTVQVRPSQMRAVVPPEEGAGSGHIEPAGTRSGSSSARSPSPADAQVASVGIPVLVPAGESAALMEIIALASVERIVPAGLDVSGDPSPNLAAPAISTPDLAALTSISIKPIEIVPLERDAIPGI